MKEVLSVNDATKLEDKTISLDAIYASEYSMCRQLLRSSTLLEQISLKSLHLILTALNQPIKETL
jgi:hypothetical protein